MTHHFKRCDKEFAAPHTRRRSLGTSPHSPRRSPTALRSTGSPAPPDPRVTRRFVIDEADEDEFIVAPDPEAACNKEAEDEGEDKARMSATVKWTRQGGKNPALERLATLLYF